MSNTQLPPAHELILRALEKANTVHGRTVFCSEVEKVLTNVNRQKLREKYAKPLNTAARVVLELLGRRNLVFVKKVGKIKSFGARSVLCETNCRTPEAGESRRRTVLRMVVDAVDSLKRPVRAVDVMEYAGSEGIRIEPFVIARDLTSLTQTGELRIAGKVRSDGGGNNLYLPADSNLEAETAAPSLTWLEYVQKHFFEIWKEHENKAKDYLPHAITTSEVSERLRSQEVRHPRLKCPKAVTNALKSLSEGTRASIRRVKIHATGAVLWVPAEVGAAAVLLFGGSGDNANKMAAALKRAEERLKRPVTVKDIRQEIREDFSLVTSGEQTLGRVLRDVSKQNIGGKINRAARVTNNIVYAGKANGHAYYVSSEEKLSEAKDYLTFLTVKGKFQKLHEAESLESEQEFRLACARYGRVLQFKDSANCLRLEILTVLAKNNTRSEIQIEMEDLLRKSEITVNESSKWLRDNPQHNLPHEVNKYIAGWTAGKLIDFYMPYYPMVRKMKHANRIITLYAGYLRRIENPVFGSRFRGGIESCEYLFDKTDALIHAAIKWGGNNMRFCALTAKYELGTLRDFRFVLPALESKDYEVRRSAIMCLMFLQYPETFDHIFNTAVGDEVAEVREIAILAYLFCKGDRHLELLEITQDTEVSNLIKNRKTSDILYF